MTKTYGLLSDEPRGRRYQRPRERLTEPERAALTKIVQALGPSKAAVYLGVSPYVLTRAIQGGYIQGTSFDVIAEGVESAALKQAVEEREKILSTPNNFLRDTIPIDAEHLEKLRALTTTLSHGQCARRLGVSETTVARALAGSPISQQQHALLIRGLITTPLPEPLPPPPRAACPHCDGFAIEETLARWLTDVRNRRVCRELLAAAQQKRNNIK